MTAGARDGDFDGSVQTLSAITSGEQLRFVGRAWLMNIETLRTATREDIPHAGECLRYLHLGKLHTVWILVSVETYRRSERESCVGSNHRAMSVLEIGTVRFPVRRSTDLPGDDMFELSDAKHVTNAAFKDLSTQDI
jgi:hypothetical protein